MPVRCRISNKTLEVKGRQLGNIKSCRIQCNVGSNNWRDKECTIGPKGKTFSGSLVIEGKLTGPQYIIATVALTNGNNRNFDLMEEPDNSWKDLVEQN